MLLVNQPKYCWPKVLYYVSLNKPKYIEINGWICWQDYISTRYLGKARMLNKKLPVKYRQIDVRSRAKKNLKTDKIPYALEGSYDKRFNYNPRFKFCKTKATQETPD